MEITRIGMLALVPICCHPAAAQAQEVAWEARPGFTGSGPIVVSNGVVVTGNITANRGIIGIDAETGRILWRVPGKMLNGPAADGRNAYASVFVNDVTHRLLALDLKSGKVVWSAEGPDFGSGTRVQIDGGRVYLTGRDGKARAFDAANGKLLWTFAYSPGKGHCPTSMTPEGGRVYFGGGEETHAASQGVFLWALDAATGKEIWRFALKPESYSRIGECVTAPAAADGVVAVTGWNIIHGLDATTGAVRWKQEVRGVVEGRERRRTLSPPHILEGRVYAIFEEGLAGWDLKSGARVFNYAGHFPTEESNRRLLSAGGELLFTANFEQPELKGNRQGFLYALQPATGQVTWKHRVNRPSQYSDPEIWPTSEFVVAGGAVYYENFQFIAKVRR